MKTSPSTRRILGALIFALGVLSSTLLTTGLAGGGLEATLYGFERYTTNRFDGLSCPPLMTRSETASIHVSVNNPSNMVITPFITIDVSTPGSPDTQQTQVNVPPGQTRELQTTVSAENIDRMFFIFVKANRSASYPVDTAEGLCGILVLDVPLLSGMQILAIWLALGLLCTPLGLWLWLSGVERYSRVQGVMKALAVTALGGLLVGLPGYLWMIAVLFVVVTVLLVMALLRLAARV
jgi:hypothetical protein